MSVNGDITPTESVDRLQAPLLTLARRIREGIAGL